jgi:hypothetical protein
LTPWIIAPEHRQAPPWQKVLTLTFARDRLGFHPDPSKPPSSIPPSAEASSTAAANGANPLPSPSAPDQFFRQEYLCEFVADDFAYFDPDAAADACRPRNLGGSLASNEPIPIS